MCEYIEIGQIVNTHGIKGEVKINAWTDDLKELERYDCFYFMEKDKPQKLHVKQLRFHKNCALAFFEEIVDMNAAERYKGKTLYIEKETLPEGRYYIADLIGLTVKDEKREYGPVLDVFSTGANDVYEIKRDGAKNLLLPAIKDVVREINLREGYILVSVPEGLDDE